MPTTTGERFQRAVSIMARLRGPGGCPWDREQTFDSIKPYTLEETYEVLEAIDEALPAAAEVARKFDSEILVLHVSEHDYGRAVVYTLETPADATAIVADAVKMLRDAGIAAKGQLLDKAAGHVAKAIVETAEANGSDLIVMGSRGRSDLAGLVLGSTAHKVIHFSDRPVLVVR